MHSLKPTHMRMIFNPVTQDTANLNGNQGFCPDKIDFPQKMVHLYQLPDMWPDMIGNIRKNPDDLPSLSILMLPDFVVHLKEFHRLNIDCLAGCRFIVDNPLNPAFMGASERNNQSAIPQG